MATWMRTLRSFDWLLTTAMFFLLLLSVVLMYGLSLNQPEEGYGLFYKQIAYTIVDIGVYTAISMIQYRTWQTFRKIIYWAGILLLVLVLLIGVDIRNTTGWLRLGPLSLQPVELAKICIIIFLAGYFSSYAREFFLWRHIIISGAAVAIAVGLILLQPDFGSSMVIVATWVVLLLMVRVRTRHLVILGLAGVIVAVSSWLWLLQPYQKQRIATFLNPQANPLDEGYNVRQSVIAVGSGQWFGRGFALGSQSQLHFLPEAQTDFIFAVIGEEFGFVGVALLFLAYLVIIIRLGRTAWKTDDNFAAYYCLGLAAMLLVQLFINIGMNMGIAPVTGIPLPLVSAGGSSILAIAIGLGIANNMSIKSRGYR